MSDCQDCPGGESLTYELNPDLTVSQIIRVGNRVILPRRYEPGEICFNALRGVDVDADASTKNNGEVLPLLWDPTTCCVGVWTPPCPAFIDYDPAAMSEPPAVDLTAYPIGTTTFYAVNSVLGCVDAIWDCATSTWREFCAGSAAAGCQTEDVVYNVAGWTFPATYDRASTTWMVQGVNRITEVCTSGGSTNCCPAVAEYSEGYTSTAGTGPPDWNALTWTTAPVFGMTGIGAIADCSTHEIAVSGDKRAFRFPVCAPPGSAGPITHSIDYVDTYGPNSHLSVGLYDTVSGTMQPVASNNVGVQAAGPEGPIVRIFPGTVNTGDTMTFAWNLNAGVDASNTVIIWWNVGSGYVETDGTLDRMRNIRVGFGAASGSCCFTWPSINSLVQYMNSHDPNGSGWVIQGATVRRTVALGIGAQYGALNSCTHTAPPSVLPCTP